MARRPTHKPPQVAIAADTRPRLIPPHEPVETVPTESVEDFLARGGTVESLEAGARGQPVLRSLQETHKANWRTFKINRKSEGPEA